MNKTPIQQLIDKLNESNPKIDFLHWIQDKQVQERLLESEKDLFVNFYAQGFINFESGVDYYDNFFKTDEHA